MLDEIEDRNGAVMADRVLAVVRRILAWHAVRVDDFRSPIVRGMARTKPKERARERVLDDDEIRAVWNAAKGAGRFGLFVRFILLTAARRTEAAAMPWAEVNDGVWVLPPERNKTKTELTRPLARAALALLEEIARGRSVRRSASAITRLAASANSRAALDEASGTADWTLHDLRRTARSLMSRAGVRPDVAELALGHVIAGVRGTYDRHEYLAGEEAGLRGAGRPDRSDPRPPAQRDAAAHSEPGRTMTGPSFEFQNEKYRMLCTEFELDANCPVPRRLD